MSLGRVAILGLALGCLGCGDGVERGSVAVPDRSALLPGGGDAAKTPQTPGKKQAADTKVITPGGKKM
jgi:hypothetical protein